MQASLLVKVSEKQTVIIRAGLSSKQNKHLLGAPKFFKLFYFYKEHKFFKMLYMFQKNTKFSNIFFIFY